MQKLSTMQYWRVLDCITMSAPSIRVNFGCLMTKGSLENSRSKCSACLSSRCERDFEAEALQSTDKRL